MIIRDIPLSRNLGKNLNFFFRKDNKKYSLIIREGNFDDNLCNCSSMNPLNIFYSTFNREKKEEEGRRPFLPS